MLDAAESDLKFQAGHRHHLTSFIWRQRQQKNSRQIAAAALFLKNSNRYISFFSHLSSKIDQKNCDENLPSLVLIEDTILTDLCPSKKKIFKKSFSSLPIQEKFMKCAAH